MASKKQAGRKLPDYQDRNGKKYLLVFVNLSKQQATNLLNASKQRGLDCFAVIDHTANLYGMYYEVNQVQQLKAQYESQRQQTGGVMMEPFLGIGTKPAQPPQALGRRVKPENIANTVWNLPSPDDL